MTTTLWIITGLAVWFALGLAIGIVIGKGTRHADLREGTWDDGHGPDIPDDISGL